MDVVCSISSRRKILQVLEGVMEGFLDVVCNISRRLVRPNISKSSIVIDRPAGTHLSQVRQKGLQTRIWMFFIPNMTVFLQNIILLDLFSSKSFICINLSQFRPKGLQTRIWMFFIPNMTVFFQYITVLDLISSKSSILINRLAGTHLSQFRQKGLQTRI